MNKFVQQKIFSVAARNFKEKCFLSVMMKITLTESFNKKQMPF